MSAYQPRHAARASRPGRTARTLHRAFLPVVFVLIVAGATGNHTDTTAGHGQFRHDVRLDTTQVELGAPLPECGTPADHDATACTVPSPDGVLIANTDGTTTLIPTPEG